MKAQITELIVPGLTVKLIWCDTWLLQIICVCVGTETISVRLRLNVDGIVLATLQGPVYAGDKGCMAHMKIIFV